MSHLGKWGRGLAWLVVGSALLLLVAVTGANLWMVLTTNQSIKTVPEELPKCEFALVLGTSPASPYLMPRVEAAAALFHAGNVRRLILSGTGEDPYYDEVAYMRAALLRMGIPASALVDDPLGRRTFDSVWRAREFHGAREFIVVSQRFHNHRALYLSRAHGIEAHALAAADPVGGPSWTLRAREWAARVLALIDAQSIR